MKIDPTTGLPIEEDKDAQSQTPPTGGQPPPPPPTDDGHDAQDGPPTNTPPVNYEDLLKTDKALQTLLDKERTKAANTAREKERTRQQQLAAANLSRKEKEALMKPEELAEMYKQEAEELRNQIAQGEEIRQLTAEINGILEESKIPFELFNAGLDYYKTPADEIRERALMFAKYDFLPKGELEKHVTVAVNEKLKQKPPETRVSGTSGDSAQPDTLIGALQQHYKKE